MTARGLNLSSCFMSLPNMCGTFRHYYWLLQVPLMSVMCVYLNSTFTRRHCPISMKRGCLSELWSSCVECKILPVPIQTIHCLRIVIYIWRVIKFF